MESVVFLGHIWTLLTWLLLILKDEYGRAEKERNEFFPCSSPHTTDENTISISPPPKTTEETRKKLRKKETSSSLAPPPHTTDENTISISPPTTTEETGPTNLFDQRKMRACRSKVTY